MIYIISESTDISTNKVIEWLSFYGESFKRINTESDLMEMSLTIDDMMDNLSVGKNLFWIRRGYFPFLSKEIKKSLFSEYFKNEYFHLTFLIENFSKQTIGSFSKEISNNKLENLILAKRSDINIPKTIVTNKKKDVFNYFKDDSKLITKPISKNFSLKEDNYIFSGKGTQLLCKDDIPEFFSMSLVQEYIEKEFEIRIFFIKKYFFAMAIFSQNDEETRIDYRNYNFNKPNRCVPFNLPNEILDKLITFTKISNHDTGSIDLIFTKNGEYVFLEINPMGQFDWLSGNCNYYIEKEIANILIELHNEQKNNN